MNTLFKYPSIDNGAVISLARDLNCSQTLAAILVNRRLSTADQARRFLSPTLAGLADPFSLKDMKKAVSRIYAAIENNEKILIFGDFDADGITATCLLNDFFTYLNADVAWYIPHRIKEGYSLQPEHIDMALDLNVDLIITVDCGSASNEAVDAALREDIDVIITDHHEVRLPMPSALALINPKRPDCPSGLDYLAGVGVAFYLVIALRKHLREMHFFDELAEPNLLNFTDLVAIGTIGDMVPLINENRILSKTGLRWMRTGTRPGITSLSTVSRIDHRQMDSDDIAFRIVPRINAAGRMSHARICVEHLSSSLLSTAQETAVILDQLNQKRQQVEKTIIEGIETRIARYPDVLKEKALVLWDKKWNPSVLGIAASRLARRHTRPVVLISTGIQPATGSCRSIDGVNILEVLTRCGRYLSRYGGHAMAAGLSLDMDRLEAFAGLFQEQVSRILSQADMQKIISIDKVLSLDDITMELAQEINSLRPFGNGNPEPLFMSNHVRVVSSHIIGINHRKMILQDAAGSGKKVEAFHFNLNSTDQLPDAYDTIVYRLKINKFTMNSPQIIIEDL